MTSLRILGATLQLSVAFGLTGPGLATAAVFIPALPAQRSAASAPNQPNQPNQHSPQDNPITTGAKDTPATSTAATTKAPINISPSTPPGLLNTPIGGIFEVRIRSSVRGAALNKALMELSQAPVIGWRTTLGRWNGPEQSARQWDRQLQTAPASELVIQLAQPGLLRLPSGLSSQRSTQIELAWPYGEGHWAGICSAQCKEIEPPGPVAPGTALSSSSCGVQAERTESGAIALKFTAPIPAGLSVSGAEIEWPRGSAQWEVSSDGLSWSAWAPADPVRAREQIWLRSVRPAGPTPEADNLTCLNLIGQAQSAPSEQTIRLNEPEELSARWNTWRQSPPLARRGTLQLWTPRPDEGR